MRVLFTPVAGGSTPLSYIVPLAWACRAAGHEVRIAALPTLTPATNAAGLPPVEVGHGYDTLAGVVEARGGARVVEPSVTRWNRSGLARPDSGSDQTATEWRERAQRAQRDHAANPWVRTAEVMAPDLLRFAERWRPQLVVGDALVFAAPLVAARLGIPLVRYIWGPDLLRLIGYPLQGQPGAEEARTHWPTKLVELYEAHGVVPRNDYAAGTVDPWPTSLQILPGAPGRIPMRFVPFNGATVAPDWVLDRPARPRVCVTWGTTTTTLGGDEAFVLPRIVDALGGLDIEVVLAVSAADGAKLGRLPGNARIAESLPLHLLMPTCAAIVNQAGAGTLLTAASHGVPQVFLPQTAECPFNAANFSASGAGIALDVADAGTDAIAGAVTTALTDEAMRAAAHKVRDEIAATPPPSAVVSTLEDLARG